MGHWSYLAANRTSNPNYHLDWGFVYDDIQIVMAAKYALPPLWHSIFSESDLQICSITFDNGETWSHPVYITRAEVGIQRAADRRSKFCDLFSENVDDIYDRWVEALKLFNGCYIHMDWSDVAGMGNDDEIKEMNLDVKAGIRAFESDAVLDWERCFRVCSASFDTETKRAILNPYNKNSRSFIEGDLLGYRFVRKANKKGKMEWVAENEEDPQRGKWWEFWRK